MVRLCLGLKLCDMVRISINLLMNVKILYVNPKILLFSCLDHSLSPKASLMMITPPEDDSIYFITFLPILPPRLLQSIVDFIHLIFIIVFPHIVKLSLRLEQKVYHVFVKGLLVRLSRVEAFNELDANYVYYFIESL